MRSREFKTPSLIYVKRGCDVLTTRFVLCLAYVAYALHYAYNIMYTYDNKFIYQNIKEVIVTLYSDKNKFGCLLCTFIVIFNLPAMLLCLVFDTPILLYHLCNKLWDMGYKRVDSLYTALNLASKFWGVKIITAMLCEEYQLLVILVDDASKIRSFKFLEPFRIYQLPKRIAALNIIYTDNASYFKAKIADAEFVPVRKEVM